MTRLASLIAVTCLLLIGCRRNDSASTAASNKVRVGYIGLTCEAPIFSAVENGFFKEEGLDVSLVKCEWANYKDVLALGGFDITHHLVMYFLKPIEQGLDVKFTGGIHRGCLRVQAGKNSSIDSIKDLRGKRIGVPGMGTPPFIFANRVLGANGIDPSKEITWRVFPAGELGLALDKGEVDAVANSEPIGSLLLAEGKVKNVADQATDAPYKDEYCCAVIVNGKFLAANPKAAAAATRALLKAAKWVETNPAAAARLSVEKGYLASNVELNTVAISHLRYVPSVSGAEFAVNSAAAGMKVAGMLSPSTDVSDLAKRAFVHLDGVTDEWLQNLRVEKVAGGQIPPDQDIRLYAELILHDTEGSCCKAKKVLEAQSKRTKLGAVSGLMEAQEELVSVTPVEPPSVLRWRTMLAVPLAAAFAFGLHLFIAKNESPLEARSYKLLYVEVIGVSILLALGRRFSPGLRRWMANMWPVFTAAIVFICIWDVITVGLRILPLPYFPGPAAVLRSLINDRFLLLDSTWHSLALLLGGYSMGVIAGLISGVCIGWSAPVRYWGMPILKVVGPIPATAWIPLAMVLSPSAIFSSAALIALAVWFPVTMLTASGISNTRASYLDVARTLGAGPGYLIFRVAIPAALPNIFIGLFMGLGASFLTLVVAESVGVKSGLGWYVSWAQGWAEYGKVFAALIIMAAFFSTIMTLLFKVRDRVLVWQKGVIKW